MLRPIHKGYCLGCPFNCGEPDSEMAYNLGCLPGVYEINQLRATNSTAWACHSEPHKVCCGHAERCNIRCSGWKASMRLEKRGNPPLLLEEGNGMRTTDAEIELFARKLIETFAAAVPGRVRAILTLAGALETFSESVMSTLEQEVAKALRNALEEALRRTAPGSLHDDATAFAAVVKAEPRRQRPWRPPGPLRKVRKFKR